MKKYRILIYLILLFSASCKSQKNGQEKINDDKSQARLLNNLALKTYVRNNCEKDSIEKSIKEVKQAIKLDNTHPVFYSNEAQMYCSLEKYQEAIKVLNEYLDNFPNSVELETLKGFIFEKTGNLDSATASYSDAIKHYDIKIQNDPTNVSLLLNRAFLLFFTQSDSKAKIEYTRIVNKFPNDERVKDMHEDFYSFERKSYITQLFSPCN